jgi:hypothetical protein
LPIIYVITKRFDLRVVSQLFYPELVSSGQALTELIEELSSHGVKIKAIASQPTILGIVNLFLK